MVDIQALFNTIGTNVSNVTEAIKQQPLAVTIQQTISPWQFWVNTGVTVLVGFGIFCIPLLSSGNPIKKANAVKEFTKITGRPTILIDHSKQALFSPSMIDNKTVSLIIKNMNKFNGADFNLVLNSGGGQVFSSQLISDAMQKYKGKIEIYVPKYAMSGATLLAFSGSNIHMTPYSSLGMLDAQIGGFMSQGSAEGWNEVVERKKDKANDNSILHARVGKQVTASLRENIYNLVKNKTSRANDVVDYFTSGKYEHIKQVKMEKMVELGFNNIFQISKHEERLLCDMVD